MAAAEGHVSRSHQKPYPRTDLVLWPGRVAAPPGVHRRYLGGAPGFNYATDYREVDGIIIPTKRRIYGWKGEYQLVPEPLLIAIDMGEITIR